MPFALKTVSEMATSFGTLALSASYLRFGFDRTTSLPHTSALDF
jgi:hypothetical protein